MARLSFPQYRNRRLMVYHVTLKDIDGLEKEFYLDALSPESAEDDARRNYRIKNSAKAKLVSCELSAELN